MPDRADAVCEPGYHDGWPCSKCGNTAYDVFRGHAAIADEEIRAIYEAYRQPTLQEVYKRIGIRPDFFVASSDLLMRMTPKGERWEFDD